MRQKAKERGEIVVRDSLSLHLLLLPGEEVTPNLNDCITFTASETSEKGVLISARLCLDPGVYILYPSDDVLSNNIVRPVAIIFSYEDNDENSNHERECVDLYHLKEVQRIQFLGGGASYLGCSTNCLHFRENESSNFRGTLLKF